MMSKHIHRLHGSNLYLFVFAFFSCLSEESAFSAAKATASGSGSGASCTSPSGSSFTTPDPVRTVYIPAVGSSVFQLPNGVTANFSADLHTMLQTSVSNSSSFNPTDAVAPNPCNEHIEFRGDVTSLQLNIGGAGVTFGYNPSGQLGTVSNITGSVSVSIGAISMDFSVWKCAGGVCQSVAGSTANQNTVGVLGSFEVDFSQIKTGADFFYNTGLATLLRTIMDSGTTLLASSKQLSSLPWQATVKAYDPVTGLLTFDAGTSDHIAANQEFEVFSPVDTTPTGVCNVFALVGIVHTTAGGLSGVSAMAAVDSLVNPQRGVLVGDLVRVHLVN